jgi:hypothetical protein
MLTRAASRPHQGSLVRARGAWGRCASARRLGGGGGVAFDLGAMVGFTMAGTGGAALLLATTGAALDVAGRTGTGSNGADRPCVFRAEG